MAKFFPGDWERWHADPLWNKHGGESYKDLLNRCVRSFYSILQINTKDHRFDSMAIVGHQSMVKALICYIKDAGFAEYQKIAVPQNSVTVIEYNAK